MQLPVQALGLELKVQGQAHQQRPDRVIDLLSDGLIFEDRLRAIASVNGAHANRILARDRPADVRLIQDRLTSRAPAITPAGRRTARVADIGMPGASDNAIVAHVAGTGLVIVSADADFGELLAASVATPLSVVLLRSADHLTLTSKRPCWRRACRQPPGAQPTAPPRAGACEGRSPHAGRFTLTLSFHGKTLEPVRRMRRD